MLRRWLRSRPERRRRLLVHLAQDADVEAEGEDGPPPLDHAFTPAEADQFLFHVLKRLVLGGRGNAPDAGWEPYLDATRALFRRLLRLRRRDGALHVSSLVLQVVDVDADFKLFGSAFGGGGATKRGLSGLLCFF